MDVLFLCVFFEKLGWRGIKGFVTVRSNINFLDYGGRQTAAEELTVISSSCGAVGSFSHHSSTS